MPCSSTYCISGTSLVYDDTYGIAPGTYSGYNYFTGSTNGYFLFYSSGETRWCVAPNLGNPCELFGPEPTTETCPDLYEEFFNSGTCVTTSTTTSACLNFDFDAVFDCAIPPTPTPSVTVTPTITPTPTVTPTNPYVLLVDVVGINKKPSPSLTPSPTPTSTPDPTRACNFSGTVQFNIIEGYIKCANSSKFENCFTGEFYFTTETVYDQNSQALIENYVYGGFVDGISTCFIFRGFVEYISGPSVISITNIYGSANEGKCVDCQPIPSQTPTKTPTPTPTPTLSPIPITCFLYSVTNDGGISQEFRYTDCGGNIVTSVVSSKSSTQVCAGSLPSVFSPSMVVELIGPCPTPTPTPTKTQTPTPTSSPITIYNWFYSDLSYPNGAFACLFPSGNLNLYSDVSSLVVGDVLYVDGSLTTPFVGDSGWYKVEKDCLSCPEIYGAQIDSNGTILDIITC